MTKKRCVDLKAIVSLFLAAATVLAFWVAKHFAKKVVKVEGELAEPLKIKSITADGKIVELSRGEDSDLRGKFSLLFDGGSGHARLGDITNLTKKSVFRRVLQVDAGTLTAGSTARLTGWWFYTPEAVGVPFKNITVAVNNLQIPAWLFQPKGSRNEHLAIHVHGRGARRQETLRGVKVFAETRIDSLVISYRNDPEYPADGRYGLGITEKEDLIAVLEWAFAAGYSEISIFGWSMGGTITLLALEEVKASNKELFAKVSAVILDSPAIDWQEILLHHAKLSKLPKPVAKLGISLLKNAPTLFQLEGSVSVRELNPKRLVGALPERVLIIASEKDTFVPSKGAVKLAALAPQKIQMLHTSYGEHVKIWNENPKAWESAITEFLGSI